MTQIIATSVCNASDRSNKNGYTDLTSTTAYTLGSTEKIVIFAEAVGDDGDRILSSFNYSIQYSTDGSSYSDLPTSNTSGPYIGGPSVLVDDSTVATGERRADANGSIGGTDGYVVSGREHESDNEKSWADRVDDQQTEFQVAVNFTNAPASTTYYFRYTLGTRAGTFLRDSWARVITPAASGTDYTRSATDVVTNTIVNTVSSGKDNVRSVQDNVSYHIQVTEVIPAVTKNYSRSAQDTAFYTIFITEVIPIVNRAYSRSGSSFGFTFDTIVDPKIFVEKVLSESITAGDSVIPDHDQTYTRTPDDESVVASDSAVVSISFIKTDGVTVGDSGARDKDQAYTRAPNDESVTVGDSASLAIAFVADDSLAVSDTPVIDEDNVYTRAPDDESVAVFDDATFALSIVQQDGVTALADNPAIDHDDNQPAVAEDTFSVSDSVSLVIGVALESSVEADDIPSIDEDNFVTRSRQEDCAVLDDVLLSVSLSTSDVFTVSDSAVTDQDNQLKLDIDEFFVVSDSVFTSATFSVIPEETFVVTDSVVSDTTSTIGKTESLTISDSVFVTVSYGLDENVFVVDSVITDHDDDQNNLVSELATISDSVATVVSYAVFPDDVFVISDNATTDTFITITKTENVAVIDDALLASSLSVDADVFVIDSVATDQDNNVKVNPDEFLTISDSVVSVVSYAPILEDTFEVTDQISRVVVFDRGKTDFLTISDSVDISVSLTTDAADVVEISEDIIADKDGANTRQPSEPVLINDSVNFALFLVIPDTGTVNDTANAVKGTPFVRQIQDSISVGDGTGIGIEIKVGDQFEIDDRGNLTHGRNPKDEVSIDDAPAKTRQPKCNAIAEDSNILDITFIKVSEVTVGDSAIANKQQDLEEQIADEINASDSVFVQQPQKTEVTVTIFGNGGIDPNLLKEAQAMSVLNIWNTALTTLGITTIQSINEGSPQQVLLSNVFPLFKQQFLADHVWNGGKKTKKLSLLTDNAGEVVFPVSRWSYAYVLPSDSVRIWRLNGLENQPNYTGGFANNLWEIEVVVSDEDTANEASTRCLCTNESTATVEYVFDVPDGNLGLLLSPLVKHAMGRSLAVYVAQNFGKNSTEIAQLEALAKEAVLAAKSVDGQEGTPQIMSNTSLLGVRYL